MLLMTFFTLGFVKSDRLPLPLDSTIVGNVELLFLLNEPKRNERDSGRRRCKVPVRDVLGEDVSLEDFSNSVVTNLSSSAISFEFLFGTLDEVVPFPDDEVAAATSESTSESCNNKE
jgi:hypothetical protein